MQRTSDICAAAGGATVSFVTGAIGIGRLLLRQAAWLLPDVDAVAYHRRNGLPIPGDD